MQLYFCGFNLKRNMKFTRSNCKLWLRNMILFLTYKDAKEVVLPPKIIQCIHFNLNEEERFLQSYYIASTRRSFNEFKYEKGKARSKKFMEVHTAIIRMMQICTAPYLVTKNSKLNTNELKQQQQQQQNKCGMYFSRQGRC